MRQTQTEMTFKSVGGLWQRVDSQEPEPPTLADVLKQYEITIDDDAQFCRIIRYYTDYVQTITYRAYSMAKVTLTISEHAYI